jgi:hypothetical protein
MPKKQKIPILKVGQQVRILLGPRRGQIDVIKQVAMTPQKSPVYFLEGDKERLAYLSHGVVDEAKAKVAEAEAKDAKWKDFGQQNNTASNESTGKNGS